MKALVLGGTGPTGPIVVEGLLDRGYQVTIMHSGQHEVEYTRPVEHIHGEVHFEEPLRAGLGDRTFDVVVAAYGRLKITSDVLVGRTPRVVSIGGSNAGRFDPPQPDAYGKYIGQHGCDPEIDRWPYLLYQAERRVIEHHEAGHYNATHIRIPMAYGPRQPGNADWSIVRRILDGRKQLIIPDGGLKMESRVYVPNAAQALLLAIDKPQASAGQVYMVADREILTMRERVETIAQALNHEFELISMPHDLAHAFHPYGRGQDHWLLDSTKIRAELGFEDVVPTREGIAAAARWLADNPAERGGELEKVLGDPFNYQKEDAVIRAFQAARQAVLDVGFPEYQAAHQYRHPKKPNETWQRPESTPYRMH